MMIQVNGEARSLSENSTVAELLTELKLEPKYLAVERNAQVVPRREHAECVLQEGDQLEIVTLKGGG